MFLFSFFFIFLFLFVAKLSILALGWVTILARMCQLGKIRLISKRCL